MKFLKRIFYHLTKWADNRHKFIHIKTLSAKTNLTWQGEHYKTIQHSYILKENGYGDRIVVIIDGAHLKNLEAHYAKNTAMYVRVALPWQHGAEFSDIPSYQTVCHDRFINERN